MNLNSAILLLVALAMSSCTTILTATTGNQGIQEDPTERTTGTIIEDEIIETKVAVNLRSQEPALKESNIDVISHNSVVLLVGQVESDALRTRGLTENRDVIGVASHGKCVVSDPFQCGDFIQ